MAPEVIMNKKYGNKADCWSLGVILFELLTNQHPYIKEQDTKINLTSLKNSDKIREQATMYGVS